MAGQSIKMQGFTLVEMVLVLILTAILAVALLARWPDTTVINLGAQVQQLAGDIRYTQMLSMTSGRRHFINLTATGYTIQNSSGLVKHPGTGQDAAFIFTGSTLTPVTSYQFGGRGIPYAGGSTTPMPTNATITLTDSLTSTTRTVVITARTGLVPPP